MRDLKENLRQAALLDMVAAVNQNQAVLDNGFPGAPPPSRSAESGERPNRRSSETEFSRSLASKEERLAAFYSKNTPRGITTNQNTLKDFIKQKPKAISIPKPRSFEIGSCVPLEGNEGLAETIQSIALLKNPEYNQMLNGHEELLLSPAPSSTTNSLEDKRSTPTYMSLSPKLSREFTGLHGTGYQTSEPKITSPERQSITGKINDVNKENQRNQATEQLNSLKRHVTTSKKKEQMKRLQEIAKCDAVDISEEIPASLDSLCPLVVQSQRNPTIKAEETMPVKERLGSDISLILSEQELKEIMAARKRELTKSDLFIEGTRRGDLPMYNEHRFKSKPLHSDNYAPNDYSEEKYETTEELDGLVGKSFSFNFLDNLPHQSINIPPLLASHSLADDRRRLALAAKGRQKEKTVSLLVNETELHLPQPRVEQISLVGKTLPDIDIVKSQTTNEPKEKVASFSSKKEQKRPTPRTTTETNIKTSDNNELSQKSTDTLKNLLCTSLTKSSSPKDNAYIKHEHDNDEGMNFKKRQNREEKKTSVKENEKNKNIGANSKKEMRYITAPKHVKENRESRISAVDNCNARSMSEFEVGNEFDAELEDISDPVNHPMSTSPRYMGTSSRIPEDEVSSQFLYIKDRQNDKNSNNESFRILKALDSDVYFDFQHRKYRNNESDLTLFNTSNGRPRTHFLKVKYSETSQS